MQIRIMRQKSPDDKPYTEIFSYEGDGNMTVSDFLTELNSREHIVTDAGKETELVVWECNCKEEKCGACAMVINNVPRLACGVFLKDAAENGIITLEPLRKFPLVADLKMDRSVMFENLKQMRIWLEEKAANVPAADERLTYKSGMCLMCGCCLEVCPNYMPDRDFSGAIAFVQAYKNMEQSVRGEHLEEMKKAYRDRFYADCSNSLSCKKVCPMDIPLDELQSRANRYALRRR